MGCRNRGDKLNTKDGEVRKEQRQQRVRGEAGEEEEEMMEGEEEENRQRRTFGKRQTK